VQADAGNRFNGALQIKERKACFHEFKNDRPILQLAAHAAHARGENAPVVELHRFSETRLNRCRGCRRWQHAAVAARLHDKSCLVHQFVAFEHFLFVPMSSIQPEAQTGAFPSCLRI